MPRRKQEEEDVPVPGEDWSERRRLFRFQWSSAPVAAVVKQHGWERAGTMRLPEEGAQSEPAALDHNRVRSGGHFGGRRHLVRDDGGEGGHGGLADHF
jgi:hypothetical protein